MNKSELTDRLTERLGDKRVAAEAIDGLVDIINRAVARDEKVSITGFGTFEKQTRPARKARNPRTGETVRLKKTAVPKFRPGTQFKSVAAGETKLGREPKHTPLLPAGVTSPRTRRLLEEAAGSASTNGRSTASRARKTATEAAATTASAKRAAGATAKKTTRTAKTAAKSTANKTSKTTKSAAKKAPARKGTTTRTRKTASR